MAFVEDVCATLADQISAYLAPYQPNLPDFPNADPRAGTIPATLVEEGQPIQDFVATRIKNGQATVYVYAGKTEKRIPFVADFDPASSGWTEVATNHYLATFEVTRSQKQVIIEVWADTYEHRRAVSNRISVLLGDVFRQTEKDGTITVVTYANTVPFDGAQNDSQWIDQIHVMADFTITDQDDAYTVTETQVVLTIESDGQDIVLPTITNP